ncbi:MAG: hypothetical protein M3P32_05375 [Chloroflexota bacterium]|nr:hypothetical protein [Chloroflexota bacterium]
MTRRTRGLPAYNVLAGLVLLLAGCSSPSTDQSRTFQLAELNDSGVSGTAVLTDLGNGSTRVVVDVDPAGHLEMPAHVHHGTCADLVPQPFKFLAVVVDGKSDTVLALTLEELLAGDLAINVHSSLVDMDTYTACVDLN